MIDVNGVRRLRLPHCSLLDIAALMLPVWVAMILTRTSADVDLWGHLRFGTDLITGKGLPSIDPYSFTADTPWVNHEWLSEAAVAVCYAALGSFGLNLIKLAVIGSIGALIWRHSGREGGSPSARTALATLVLFASYTRTQALRPQLFSVLLFTLLLVALDRRERGVSRGRIALPLLFCVWANAHGGWIVGFGTLGLWIAFDLIERRSLASWVDGAIVLAGSLAATLVNPYGYGHWAFLQRTVGLSRPDVTDWVPFTKFPALLIVFELLLPVLAVIALRSRRRLPTLRQAGVVALLAFATWRIGRVDAFLQVALAWFFGSAIVGWFDQLVATLRAQTRLSRPSPLHGAVWAAIVVTTVAITAPRLTRVYIDGGWVPDRDAVRYIQSNAPNARLLTWFDWGEYAIWHLSPVGIRVSMDGRRETVYSDRVLADHWAFYDGKNEPWRYPDAIGADAIWLPKKLSVIKMLREHGWHPLYETRMSVVLSRNAPDCSKEPCSKPPCYEQTCSEQGSGAEAKPLFPGP